MPDQTDIRTLPVMLSDVSVVEERKSDGLGRPVW
jgi:hypothetical protein